MRHSPTEGECRFSKATFGGPLDRPVGIAAKGAGCAVATSDIAVKLCKSRSLEQLLGRQQGDVFLLHARRDRRAAFITARFSSGILRDRFDDETLANNITMVEFFPYHSRSWTWSKRFAVPSQSYSHDLVRKAVGRGATIVVMRCRRPLERELPELQEVNYVTSASRSAAVSPGNLISHRTGFKDGFNRIVAAITSPI